MPRETRHMVYLIAATALGGFFVLLAGVMASLAFGSSMQGDTVIALVILVALVVLIVISLGRLWLARAGRATRVPMDRGIVIVTVLALAVLAIYTFIWASRDALSVGLPTLLLAVTLAAASRTSQKRT